MSTVVPTHKEKCGLAGIMPRLFGLVAGLVLLGAMTLISLSIGARPIAILTVLEALFTYDTHIAEHIIVHDYRLPRTLLGLLCGAAFGVSGALIQAATRNPLADPGLLGVNAGTAFFVTLAVSMLGLYSMNSISGLHFWGLSRSRSRFMRLARSARMARRR